jgi:hypothetical protein
VVISRRLTKAQKLFIVAEKARARREEVPSVGAMKYKEPKLVALNALDKRKRERSVRTDVC